VHSKLPELLFSLHEYGEWGSTGEVAVYQHAARLRWNVYDDSALHGA